MGYRSATVTWIIVIIYMHLNILDRIGIFRGGTMFFLPDNDRYKYTYNDLYANV